MTVEHAAQPRSIRATATQTVQTLPPTSRELGEVLPPKGPDGAPVAAGNIKFAKSWAHLVAGG